MPNLAERLMIEFIHVRHFKNSTSYNALLWELHVRGFRNRKGKPVSRAQVQRILRRPPTAAFPYTELGLSSPPDEDAKRGVRISSSTLLGVVTRPYREKRIAAFLNVVSGRPFLLEESPNTQDRLHKDPFQFILLPCTRWQYFVEDMLSRSDCMETFRPANLFPLYMSKERRLEFRDIVEVALNENGLLADWGP